MISLFSNTLCPPVNKLFLSVTKFSLYISSYISFSRLVPMTYVLLLLREPLRRLWMSHEAPDFQLFWFMLIRCTHAFMLTCTLLAFVMYQYSSRAWMKIVTRNWDHSAIRNKSKSQMLVEYTWAWTYEHMSTRLHFFMHLLITKKLQKLQVFRALQC